MKRLALALFAFSFAFVGATYYVNRPTEERYTTLANSVIESAVTIHVKVSRKDPDDETKTQHGEVQGSGVFISKDGHVLSCAHLFLSGHTLESVSIETYSGWIYPAEVLRVDKRRDLSLLHIEAKGTPAVALIDPRRLQIGQEVLSVGTPLGLTQTVTHGIISGLYRDVGDQYNLVQSDAAMNPGNSGGPLFNLRGELVGINVMIVVNSPFPTFSGLGFSVSPAQIYEFLSVYKGLEFVFVR